MKPTLLNRARGKIRRTLAKQLHRRELTVSAGRPIVSFTFDDAPRSAFTTGAAILEAHGAVGTYYLSLGLLSTSSEIGMIAGPADLERAVERGHELGCHTFDHHDAWFTEPETYIASVDRNRAALHSVLPGYRFRSFAYPKNGATAAVKPALELRFECCRGGGQTYNAGKVDLNLLSACFIDRRAQVDLGFISGLIERNAEAGGWLVFAAHEISDVESEFACPASFLESVVRLALDSGATLLPVSSACDVLRRATLAMPDSEA